MARGPLPKAGAERRRTNPPVIPTTTLPANGPDREPPECPYELAGAGERWWAWAWSRPQAAAWDDGALYFAARRASLEDDLATLEIVDSVDFAHIVGSGEDPDQSAKILEALLGTMKRLASNRVALMRECRELDNRLGLNPKAMSELRWSIVDDEPVEVETQAPSSSRVRLRAVDAA